MTPSLTGLRAQQQLQTYVFDLPAQDLSATLQSIAQAAGIQMLFDQADMRGRKAPSLAGEHTIPAALDLVLAGSDLDWGRTISDVWVIRPEAVERPAPETARSDEIAPLEEVIVTGTTATDRTVLESSVAVTVASRHALERKSARSTAQALELVPGIFVEASGGEVLNNFTARGLPGGGQSFVQILEDGLPVFYSTYLADAVLKPELSIDRLEAVRGGSSGILTVQGAGATANFITRKPGLGDTATMQLTSSDFGTRRADAWYGGPLSSRWLLGIGGFYRVSDGVRSPGYDADRGGIVRASLLRLLDSGELGLSVKLVDDRNTFLTPIALRDPLDPKPVPGLDARFGSQYSEDNAVQQVRVSSAFGRGQQITNLKDGLHGRAVAFGYHLDTQIATSLALRVKGRYTDFTNDFNALFSRGNETLIPATRRLDPVLFSDVRAMLERFAPAGAVAPALRIVSSGETIVDAAALNALNGNGLTADTALAGGSSSRHELVQDLSLRWEDGGHSLTAGVLYDHATGRGSSIGDATFISEVADNPRRLDIVAVDAQGEVVGYLTENGLLNYGNGADSHVRYESKSLSVYVNDELDLGARFRLDGGVRHEWFEDRLHESVISLTPEPVPGAFDAGGVDTDNIIANNYIGQFAGGHFTGAFRFRDNRESQTAWTVGGNFRVDDNLAMYARYASGFQTNGQNPVTLVNFAEIGLRFQSSALTASLIAFRTVFRNFLFERALPDFSESLRISGDFKVLGAEFDALWHPAAWFEMQLFGVMQNSELDVNGFASIPGQDEGMLGPPGFLQQFDGNRPERTPEVNVTVMPRLLLPQERGELYASYHYVGAVYSDIANSFELPAYGIWSIGGSYQLSARLSVRVSIENLTNELALTEGNPRAGFNESAGVTDVFYGRPIAGRNALVSLTYQF